MTATTCPVTDCTKPSRGGAGSLCPMHYHRQYRHGSTGISARNAHTPSVSHGRDYRTVMAHDHPLAPPSGRMYVHRVVLYDAIGPGTHACHWCQRPITWNADEKRNALVPDHLNGIGSDNRRSNLVPSCLRCNSVRAQQARSRALRAAGWWSRNDTIAQLRGRRRATPIEVPTPT